MNKTKKLVLSGICLSLCILLPFLTGQIPQIGNALSPMHIPVLICGFVSGWPYGMMVGFIAPLLRFIFFGMPPIFPIGVAMMFELAVYGLVSGLLYKLLPKKTISIYITLVISMLAGRMVWGVAMLILTSIMRSTFTWSIFLAGAFINAVPGIILHVLLIPFIIIAMKKVGFVLNE